MLLILDDRISNEDEDLLLRMTWLRVYKRKWWRIFSKRVNGGIFDYYGIVLKEKKDKKIRRSSSE